MPDEDEPQWLSAAEQAAWLALAGLMVRLPGVLDAQMQHDSDLTLFEYFVLSSLSMRPEHSAQMCELAAIVNGSQSRLSNVVKRLEQRGLIGRRSSPGIGRRTDAILTDEGWKVVQAAAPGHAAAVRYYVFDALDREHVDLVREIGDRILERADRNPACRSSRP